jgi:hypothetical protein
MLLACSQGYDFVPMHVSIWCIVQSPGRLLSCSYRPVVPLGVIAGRRFLKGFKSIGAVDACFRVDPLL